MRNLKKLLFAAALAATAFMSAPHKTYALCTQCCTQCDQTADCVACCRCGGGTISHCAIICS
jgi:hypothetical protein